MNDMVRVRLDPDSAERLIRGSFTPTEVPASYASIVPVLEELRSLGASSDLSRTEATVAGMAAILSQAGGPGPATASAARRWLGGPTATRSLRAKVVGASVAAGAALFGGLGVAGALPSTAQNSVAAAAAHVGIDLP